jgi:arylsulfatase A-like enzyme
MPRPLHLLLFLICVLTAGVIARADPPPNIVLILADDLGYGDIGPFGQKRIKTPVLDRLAAEGITFTSAYAGASVCAPSRCVLMTGLHTGHARIRGNVTHGAPRAPAGVALQSGDTTLASILHGAGYATAAIGKWGLGDIGAEASGLPTRQGFDTFFGYLNQSHAHNSYPSHLWRNEQRVPLLNLVPDEAPNGTGVSSNKAVFSEDLFIAEAERFLRQPHRQPFFLYFAPTLPHANNQSHPLGLEIPSLGDYAHTDWPEAEKRYAAMVTRLDADTGRILAALRENGLDQNTLVLFVSDNGPHQEGGQDPQFFDSNGPLRGLKRDLYEGGIRVPAILRWPGRAPAGRTDATPWYFPDLLPTFAALARTTAPASDGRDLSALWQGRAEPALHSRPLYWEDYERRFTQAVREGPWKAIRRAGAPVALFNLDHDLGEQNDVAAAHPDIVARLTRAMDEAHTPSPFWPPHRDPAAHAAPTHRP